MQLYQNSSKVIASDSVGYNLFELQEIRGSKILSSKNIDIIENVGGGSNIIKSEKPGMGVENFCQIYHTRGVKKISFCN